MKILFVCMGNICRSPAAEGVFQKMLDNEKLSEAITCDSAGVIAYHQGEKADGRMSQHASKRNYDLTSIARQFQTSDFSDFDLILTMDNQNYTDVVSQADSPEEREKVHKMVSYCKIHNVPAVPDPYYGGHDGFEHVMDILEDSCGELLLKIKKQI